jgi:hypothetical protein
METKQCFTLQSEETETRRVPHLGAGRAVIGAVIQRATHGRAARLSTHAHSPAGEAGTDCVPENRRLEPKDLLKQFSRLLLHF